MAIPRQAKRSDGVIRQIANALANYEKAHPQAKIEIYRHNSVSIRIRIIDPKFSGLNRAQREDELWASLNHLPEDVLSEISLLLLFTPAEAKSSFASKEFDDPIPSRL